LGDTLRLNSSEKMRTWESKHIEVCIPKVLRKKLDPCIVECFILNGATWVECVEMAKLASAINRDRDVDDSCVTIGCYS